MTRLNRQIWRCADLYQPIGRATFRQESDRDRV
jgi:hypothetical protein